MAWQKRLKGVTIYRDGSRFPILSVDNKLTDFQKYKDKKFEIINEKGESIEVSGDHVLKADDGRLTTIYHHTINKTQSHEIKTHKTPIEEVKNA